MAPEGAACEDEGEQGTLGNHVMFLILCLVSSSTTRLVKLSSKETPDVSGAAMVPEKHLAFRSTAQVGKLLPVLPCSAFSGCW